MTGFDRTLTPKTRPMSGKRTALVASLDIGTSKIACMIARLKPCPPSDALRGRTHAVELIGYSQIQSRGVKAGAVVDLAECEQAIRQAVCAGRAHGQGSRRVRAAVGRRRPAAGPAHRGRRRHPWQYGDARRHQPCYLYRHASRDRRRPHRAACAAGRLFHRRRQGYPRSPGHGGAAVRRRHERRDRGCHGRQEPDAGGRALPSQRRSHGRQPLCGGPFRAHRRRGRYRRRRGRDGGGDHHDCDYSRAAASCMPPASRSAAST